MKKRAFCLLGSFLLFAGCGTKDAAQVAANPDPNGTESSKPANMRGKDQSGRCNSTYNDLYFGLKSKYTNLKQYYDSNGDLTAEGKKQFDKVVQGWTDLNTVCRPFQNVYPSTECKTTDPETSQDITISSQDVKAKCVAASDMVSRLRTASNATELIALFQTVDSTF